MTVGVTRIAMWIGEPLMRNPALCKSLAGNRRWLAERRADKVPGRDRRRPRPATAAAVLGLWLAAGGTAAAADPGEGEALSRIWCSECHIVADDQTIGSADVPTFRQIAGGEGYTPDELRIFLVDPHPKMPPMSLTRREIEDIVAYIESLQPPQ